MAEKQFARNGAKGPDVFADDDPLAELARIVGFEPKPVAANTQRRDPSFVNIRPVEKLREPEIDAAAPRPQHPIFNLEDELLREFEMFDTPRNDNTVPEREEPRLDVAPDASETRVEQSVAERSEPLLTLDDQPFATEPVLQDEPLVEAFEPETVAAEPEPVETVTEIRQEPAFESRSYNFDPPFELDAPAERSEPAVQAEPVADTFEFDLASELEMAVGRSVEAEPVAPEPVVEQVVFEEPVAVVEPVAPPAPAPVAPRFRSLATDFRMQRATPQPAAAVEPVRAAPETPVAPVIEPIARNVREESARATFQREPHFDEPAIEWDRLAEELTGVISEPDVPQMPQGGFRSAKDVSSDELLDDVSRFPVPESPAAAAAASLAPDVTAEPKSATARFEKSVAEPQPASAADPTFEFDFDNIALELADMNFDEPPAVAPEPKPVRAPEPAAPQPIRASFVPPLVMQAPVSPVSVPPVAVAPTPVVSAPTVAAAPVKPAPAAMPDDGELPFDPSLIADAEEHPEVVPHLDVPSLPSVEPEETIAPEPEYDLDIDAEMANLFAPIKPAEPEVAAPSSATAAAVTLDTKDPQRFENGKAAIDEFDEFERALEEDFRRAMGEPMAEGDHAQPMILGPGMSYAPPEAARPRRLSRGLIVGVAAAVIGMAGLAGAYTLFFAPGGGSAGSSSTGPRVITADKEPIKVVPENPGGKTVPNQDKAVYDRVAGNATEQPKQDSLLSSTEEPIDVVQRTLGPESLPMDGGEDAIANMPTPVGETEDARLLSNDDRAAAKGDKPTADSAGPAVSPRKVRTMIVKADGTLVARETVEPQEAPATSGELKPALATPAQDASKPTDIASAIESAATTQNDPPLRTVRTTTVEAPAATTAPVPASRPADQPVNVVGTVTERGTVRKPAEAQNAAAVEQQVATAAAPGGYVMQIASLPSEAEAKKSYANLSSKFGSLIGGRGYDIKKAEISGKGTYYRVRIPVGSKDAAAALCVKYRAAGGTCLVSK